MAQVVEDEQQVGDHQRHVGQAERVGVGLAERLDRAHQVVAEEADRAAGERRQALDRGELEGGRGARRPPRRGRRRRWTARRSALGEHAVAPAQHRARPEADERVAADLALLRRLEQEAGRALGLAARSLRKAETGVSQSSSRRAQTGTTLPCSRQLASLARGSARASARSSAATAIEHFHRGRLRRPRARPAGPPGGRAGRRPLRRRARRTPRGRRGPPPRPPPDLFADQLGSSSSCTV